MTLATNLMMQFFVQQNSTPGPRLPDAYQETEYIYQVQGATTYIYTGLKITADDIVQCRVQHDVDTNEAFIGDGSSKTDSNFAIWISSTASVAYKAEFSYGDGSSASYKVAYNDASFSARDWHTYKAEAGTGASYIDDVLVGTAASVKGYYSAKKLVLFASWRGSITNSTMAGKMGECITWRGGEKIRHFIPCYRKSDSVAGFYDLCESSSPGTGTPFYIGNVAADILAGPDVS